MRDGHSPELFDKSPPDRPRFRIRTSSSNRRSVHGFRDNIAGQPSSTVDKHFRLRPWHFGIIGAGIIGGATSTVSGDDFLFL